MTETFSGGCQCGAVRYSAEGPVHHASICNCRMCQKALGNLTAPFVSFEGAVRYTRGKPTHFKSSQRVKRGFCNACGTPLTYEWMDSPISITIGSLDHPEAVIPRVEFARDNRHPIFNDYGSLIEEPLGSTDEERDLLAILQSHQHPDKDTDVWPPKGRGR